MNLYDPAVIEELRSMTQGVDLVTDPDHGRCPDCARPSLSMGDGLWLCEDENCSTYRWRE